MSGRNLSLFVVAVFTITPALFAQETSEEDRREQFERAIAGVRLTDNIAEERIASALAEETNMEFIDTPLTDAMEFISQLHGVPIILDRLALEEEGISPDEPINIVLENVSLQSALNIISQSNGVGFVVEDEVLKVTSEVAAEEKMQVRIYNVSGLMTSGGTTRSLEELLTELIEPDSWSENGGNGVIKSHGKLMIIRQSYPVHQKVSRLMQQLIAADLEE